MPIIEAKLIKVANKIQYVAERENKILVENIANNKINENVGIFTMPELAFAYLCGREIMFCAEDIFGDDIPEWCRELALKNGGPTDLVFKFTDNSMIAIEFKMVNNGDAYIKDLKKLSNLKNNNISKVFCAVIDVFDKSIEGNVSKDGRVTEISKYTGISELLPMKILKTNQSRYTSKVSALVGVWKL